MTRGLKQWIAPALAIAFAVAAPRTAAAGDSLGNINFLVGRRQTDSNKWRPVDQTTVLGVEGSWGNADWPLHFATDIYYSGASDSHNGEKTETRRLEAAIGLRKIWKSRFLRPYMGVGVTVLEDRLTRSGASPHASARDKAAGAWLGGGLFFRIGPKFDVGVAVRYVAAKPVRLLGHPINASAITGGVTIGWGWGEKKK